MKQNHRCFVVILLMCLAAIMLLEACAPKIYGARRHRRDRNCGCEYKAYPAPDSSCYLVENK